MFGFFFVITNIYSKFSKKHSYKILCIKEINAKEPIKDEKCAPLILDAVQLPEDQFRLGKTKVQTAGLF